MTIQPKAIALQEFRLRSVETLRARKDLGRARRAFQRMFRKRGGGLSDKDVREIN
jgi:hypothetical protein